MTVIAVHRYCRIMFNTMLMKSRIAQSETYYRGMSKAPEATHDRNGSTNVSIKPPNVLIYAPDSVPTVNKYVQVVERCLAANRYTVYSISSAKFIGDPWLENVEALVVWLQSPTQSQIEQSKAILKRYVSSGGKLLTFNPELVSPVDIQNLRENVGLLPSELCVRLNNLDKPRSLTVSIRQWNGNFIAGKTSQTKSLIDIDHDGKLHSLARYLDGFGKILICTLPLLDSAIENVTNDQSEAVLSYLLRCVGLQNNTDALCGVDNDEVKNRLNKAVLFATNHQLQIDFLQRIRPETSLKAISAPGIKFVSADLHDSPLTECNAEEITVLYGNDDKHKRVSNCLFDWEAYQQNLSSKRYGRVVVYADVISSTMIVFDGFCTNLANDQGPIAIARQQTKGQGRSTNKWLSPVGCAMFTLLVHIPLQSRLGHALPFIQHLTSVAVVHGIRTIAGLEDFNLTVKWPNDIYFGSTVKLGGIMVKSTVYKHTCIASIGCGVNIANNKPTTCVNNLLIQCSKRKILKCEEVIARTVSVLEELIESFQKEGYESFLKLYYKYWIHSGAEIKVQVDDSMIPCSVAGVDQSGFLLARRHDNGEVLSLHPDGNTFDIMKNLVVAKQKS